MQAHVVLRNRLAELDSQIAVLEAERKMIRKELDSIVYPVVTLPVEVTSEIFLCCVLSSESEDVRLPFGYSPVSPPLPLLLTWVCQTWRNIALKTPRLWASFSGSFPLERPRVVDDQQVAEWVDRAGSAPLSIFLHREAPQAPWAATLPRFPDSFRSMLDLSTQWTVADLRLPYSDLIRQEFRSRLQGKLPELAQLKIVTEYYSPDVHATPVHAFGNVPNLRYVVLRNIRPYLLPLPWAQLTRFRGDVFYGNECLKVLRLAACLVDCVFTGVSMHGTQQSLDCSILPAPHLTLESLELDGMGVCLDILILSTLPGLSQQDFFDPGATSNSSEVPGVSVMAHSDSPLRRLSLRTDKYLRFTQILSLLPNIVDLELHQLSVDDMYSFFESLRDTGSFLPNLKTIQTSVRSSLASTVNFGLLVDILDLRRHKEGGGQRLESFSLHFEELDQIKPPYSFGPALRQMMNLQEAGLQISMTATLRNGNSSLVWI
ncbi:hypothetical protein B0H11DRAFT_1308216 [Mycena galericulata]|nr:hypothetical protein B0H11DRAFT_1308216 [Mycena galericulata]